MVRITLLQHWVGAALKGESGGVTRIVVEKWCEALSSRVGVEATLKGESGAGTSIVVETSRFVDFLTSIES